MRVLLCNRDGDPPDAWLDDLRRALPEAQVDVWRPGLPPGYDHAVVWNVPQQLFDEQPQLRAVVNLAAGVDKLLDLRLPPALAIVRLEDAGMAVQMAEYACHALIRFFREFDAYADQQRAGHWAPRRPRARADFPVGIMGLGALGARVAQAVRQFDFPVLGWSRTRHRLAGVRCFAGAAELPAFLQATRVLVCLLPLTDATRGLLNQGTLGQLQPGGYLINVARGALLVEDDLRHLLDTGHLAGAALDVMAQEPLPADHPFWQHPQITVTPHIATRTHPSVLVRQTLDNLAAVRAGRRPAAVVDLARGY